MARRIRLPVLATLSLVAILVACVEKKTASSKAKGEEGDEEDAVVITEDVEKDVQDDASKTNDSWPKEDEMELKHQFQENLQDIGSIMAELGSLPAMLSQAFEANSSNAYSRAVSDNSTVDEFHWFNDVGNSSSANETNAKERMVEDLLNMSLTISGLKERAILIKDQLRRAIEKIEEVRERRRAEGLNVNDELFSKIANGDPETISKLGELEKLFGPFDDYDNATVIESVDQN